MPGARVGSVLTIASIVIVSACASITPAVPIASPAGSVPAAVPSQPDVVVTTAPSVEVPANETPNAPTDPPIDTPQPTDQPAGQQGPNLLITKFNMTADPFLVGEAGTAKVTVKNTGSDAAPAFDVEIRYVGTQPGDSGYADPSTVDDGLAPGSTAQVAIPVSVSAADTYTLTATVDPDGLIAESNEDDNESDLNVVALALPNLVVTEYTVDVTQDGATFNVEVANTGPGPQNEETWYYKLFWLTDAGDSGVFREDFVLQANQLDPGRTVVEIGVDSIGPGNYLSYVLVDSKEQVEETDETDNEERFDFTVE